MLSSCLLTCLAAWGLLLTTGCLGQADNTIIDPSFPRVTVSNGTYLGRYQEDTDVDVFLGVAFAQPPIGPLRFRNPVPLNSSWDLERDAQDFAGDCTAYPQTYVANYTEDCLYLNVWRPAGVSEDASLPVLVWIRGGGFSMGASSNPRFDLSYIVERSVALGQPVIGVSINYRLNAFGFLTSDEVRETGDSNFGIRDQRLGLHWVQENIGAFGGDPAKVTIFGESAGAASVGFQLTAYNGRDDGLFRYAIMQSGNPIYFSASNDTTCSQRRFDALADAVGCSDGPEPLECLRGVPYDTLDAAIKADPTLASWVPQIDGDFFARHTSQQVADGSFVHVPVIIGANTDEGTVFSPRGANALNTDADFEAYLGQRISTSTVADEFADIYALDASSQVLPNLAPDVVFPPQYGAQFRRAATFTGDMMFIAHRRASCAAWAASGTKAFCYRFNAVPMNQGDQRPWLGSTHFLEVAFVFLNLQGRGYTDYEPPQEVFEGLGESYKDLARLMSSDWIAFANSGDPNTWEGRREAAAALGVTVPHWPTYGQCGSVPRVFVFEGNVTSHVEEDTYREEGMALINEVDLEVFDR